MKLYLCHILTISILALTRSATRPALNQAAALKISILALTRSATLSPLTTLEKRLISILALTRSATLKRYLMLLLHINFNPRTHEECDIEFVGLGAPSNRFQSSHSRGVRLIRVQKFVLLYQFQSSHSRGVRPPDYF